MGKKYDNYAEAAKQEAAARERVKQNPSDEQARADLTSANIIANAMWDQVMKDPEG